MKKTSKWQKTGLSAIQIKQLCTLAGQAFKVAKLRGDPRTEDGADAYRKAGQMEAAQIESLKAAHQGHYLALRGYWFTILGNLEQAFYDFLNAGDASEARRQMAWRLMGQIAHLADGIAYKHQALRAQNAELPDLTPTEAAEQAWKYAESISRSSHRGRIADLDARGVEQLGFTLTNRTNAMLGKGQAENRNKSQRNKASKPAPTDLKEPLETASRGAGMILPQLPTSERHAHTF
jgi:hypothetical protein